MATEPITRTHPTLLDEPAPHRRFPDAPPRRQRPSRLPIVAAAVATVALAAGALLVSMDGDASSAPPTSVVPTSTIEGSDVTTSDALPPLAPLAPAPTDDATEMTVPVVPTLPPPASPPPPPTAPPAAPLLSLTDHYELDPGVHDVTITLTNAGDATLHFEIANVGDGFEVDTQAGSIAPADAIDVFVEADVSSDGDGPTPFERTIEVVSDGGHAFITVVGQVEKPGYLVADYESLPFVDYRATVRFTNVGELPVQIHGVEAPGLRLAPLPDAVPAGETLEVELAICESGSELPVFFAVPHQPLPIFTFASYVTLETDASTPHTAVHGMSNGFFPPTCEPVVTPPAGDLTL